MSDHSNSNGTLQEGRLTKNDNVDPKIILENIEILKELYTLS